MVLLSGKAQGSRLFISAALTLSPRVVLVSQRVVLLSVRVVLLSQRVVLLSERVVLRCPTKIPTWMP